MATKLMINDDELKQNWEASKIELSDDEDVISAGSEDEFEDENDIELASKKRSRDEVMDEDNEEDDDQVMVDAEEEIQTKKNKKKQKQEQGSQQNSKGLHKMSREELFKMLNTAYLKYNGGSMTTLELSNALNESHLEEPQGKELGKHTLDNLPLYLRHFAPQWKQEFRGKGKKGSKSPMVVILSSSALRAVEVLKPLSVFRCKIAKLFAKHLKVQEQVELLSRSYQPIAVGTPGRIKKLLEMDALSFEHTTHLVIDMQKDKKNMTILDLKDTAKELVEILQYYGLGRLNENKMKIVLY